MKRRRREKSIDGRGKCPKCRSTEIKIRGGRVKILLGHLLRKYHYSCRRCLIYWSSSKFYPTRRVVSHRLWVASSWARTLGRFQCFMGFHTFGDLRRSPETHVRKVRSCRRCNYHESA